MNICSYKIEDKCLHMPQMTPSAGLYGWGLRFRVKPHASFRLINLESFPFSVLLQVTTDPLPQPVKNHMIAQTDFKGWIFFPTCGFL